MSVSTEQYTFHVCIEADESTVLDVMIAADNNPDSIAKAKKAALKLLADFSPSVKKPAPVPLLETAAPDTPDTQKGPQPPAPTAGTQMPPDSAISVYRSSLGEQKKLDGAKGLLRLRCPKCGNTFGTFLREYQTEVACNCGCKINLTGQLGRYHFACPYCQHEGFGKTNLEDPEITVRCKCGKDVDLTWVPEVKEYRN